jgi:hypothetical protein
MAKQIETLIYQLNSSDERSRILAACALDRLEIMFPDAYSEAIDLIAGKIAA